MAVVVESPTELRRLDRIAHELAADAVAVMLRLNLPGARGTLRMSDHQFGIPMSDVAACLAYIEDSCLRFSGYHAASLRNCWTSPTSSAI